MGAARRLDGAGRQAVVVGCAMGADAEHITSLGYQTKAFDVSPTAIPLAQRRNPSAVDYQTADLLDPPAGWSRSFDLVVEIITVQALPDPPRHHAIINVGRLVAPGGTLLAIAVAQQPGGIKPQLPPWPLERHEIEAFATDGLDIVKIELLILPEEDDSQRWRAEFRRRVDSNPTNSPTAADVPASLSTPGASGGRRVPKT
jgi:SAM-dependent methyltransferase